MQRLFSFGVLILSVILGSSVTMASSGVDLSSSTITVDYVPIDSGSPPFTCFHNVPNVTIADADTVVVTLADLGMTDISNSIPMHAGTQNECFTTPGDYIFTVLPVDNAGNAGDPSVHYFRIVAEGTAENTVVTVLPGQCDIAADGVSACEAQVRVTNEFGIPLDVPEVEIHRTGAVYQNDANTGMSFMAGHRLQNTPIPSNNADAVVIPLTEGVGTVEISALAPSVQQSTFSPLLTKVSAYDMEMAVTIPDYGLDAEDFITYHTISVAARPLVGLMPDMSQFRLGQNNISVTPFYNSGADYTDVNILPGLLHENNPGLPITFGDIPLPALVENLNHELPNTQYISTTATGEEDFILSPTHQMPFYTEAKYMVAGQVVSYPAGGISFGVQSPQCESLFGYNCAAVSAGFIGAEIESARTVGDENVIYNLPKENKGQVVHLGDSVTESQMNSIRERAWGFLQSEDPVIAPPQIMLDLELQGNSLYTEGDTVIGPNFTYGGRPVAVLPEGKSMLVVRNGNLRINADIIPSEALDSTALPSQFTVVLVSDVQEKFPEKSNIFVSPSVVRMHGNYFADGAIMTANPFIGGILDVDQSPESTVNTNQLLIVGGLYTRNTLGGSYVLDDDENKIYNTPWGGLASGEVDASGTSLSGKSYPKISEMYDLHNLRRWSGDGQCAWRLQNPAACIDSNENEAVIIRPAY